MQTPFAKYRGQLVQYCTQSVLSNSQMFGSTTAAYASACKFGRFDLGIGCLHTAIWSTILPFPPLTMYILLVPCTHRPTEHAHSPAPFNLLTKFSLIFFYIGCG
jgi:hypothetical protein